MALTQISTAGVKDDAVTAGKIPADAIGSSEIAANAVGSSEIADEAVTLAKLPHGTSSNDGKFLRANNGADPTFEDVPAGTTINNNADNRIITGSGTANTLEGEATFTHNPSTFDTTISHSGNTPADLIIENTHNSFTGAVARLTISSGDNSNLGGMIELESNGQSHTFESRKNGNLYIGDNGTTKLTLDSDGHLNISDGDLRINTSGHGIDFSATSDASGMGNELLDDYEEGTWTPVPTLTHNPGGRSITTGTSEGIYVKIGRFVHVEYKAQWTAISGSGAYNVGVNGLPYVAEGTVHVVSGTARSNQTGYTFVAEGVQNSQINVFRRYDNGSPNENDVMYGFATYQTT